MSKSSQRPSIMDAPSAQRAVLGIGALIAAAGALFYFTRRKAVGLDDAPTGDVPPWTPQEQAEANTIE